MRRKVRMAELPCTLEGCTKLREARGYCRGHYRRFMLYGDPTESRPVGGKPEMPAELTSGGITYRQLRYWCNEGHIKAPVDPVKRARKWTRTEVRITLLLHDLVKAGLPLDLAAKVARRAITRHQAEHSLGQGILLRLPEEKITA